MAHGGPLTIGIDARAAAEEPAGRGRVVRELLAALAARDDPHHYVLYCREPVEIAGADARFGWDELGLSDPAWHAAAALRANRACDVFLSTNSYLTPWFLRVPSAIVVYDLIAFVPGARAQRRAQRIERATLRPAIRRAAGIVCISEATRRDLIARFPRAASKSTVVALAADRRFGEARSAQELASLRSRHQLPESFVLSVGTLEPRKNLERLIAAHTSLPPALRSRHPLVIVGPRGWEIERLLARLASETPEVRLLGFVGDEELAALYSLATVFCYPSLYEGFGLPVLEAMQSGAPTITSSVSSLPEVGGDAVRYVDAHSVDDIAGGLRELLESPQRREELSQRGRERAAGYSWERAAGETLSVLERISRS
jgi:glycosyltransferase involved in cell wall biosynthesis